MSPGKHTPRLSELQVFRSLFRLRAFLGTPLYDIPFLGWAGSDISKITIDGKAVSFTPGKAIYQRLKIRIPDGYSRIPVYAESYDGWWIEAFLEVNLQ